LECEERCIPQTHRLRRRDWKKNEVHSLEANIDLIRRAEMSSSPTIEGRQRAHVERMLQRAEKRSRQAQKIVEKWKAKLMELDRAGVAAKQTRLWQEEHLQEIE
jgi:hypothetical protein